MGETLTANQKRACREVLRMYVHGEVSRGCDDLPQEILDMMEYDEREDLRSKINAWDKTDFDAMRDVPVWLLGAYAVAQAFQESRP